jgi:class 3 adenylate cyclase/tetratricopeptide (TPR) repeat protein
VLVCSSCGNENPEGFLFCGFCGASLATTTAAGLEERKVVSVLFCDLVGFTATSEQQDPEDVRARIRPYHARLRREILRYGGTVEKFVGDAVMAAFGAPVAHEDDAERAVRVGLNILQAISELNAADPELNLKVRVGINTGEAVVAIDARVERGEGLVTGDVVNTAARIESVAPVNGVAVGEQTYRSTSHVFEYEPLAAVAVKGKERALPVWRAVAVRDRYGSDSVVREYKTPFVGRELEKTLLIGTFERAAQQRAVQVVTIVGEPGVGKTRLVAQLFSYIDEKPELIRWRQGRCLPYGEGITFWALGEIVKSEAAILESDPTQVVAAKLDAAVAPDELERQWLLQRLAPLVGVESESPAERQESFTAWRRYLEGLAAARSTVLVFEDLHWADDALLGFIEYLAEWCEGVPMLILCIARPELYERRPGWAAGQRNAHTINLAPLSDEETSELVSHLSSTTVLTSDLRQRILEQAGGNPLYAEELVRLLSDRGIVTDETALPDSVQALIAARLDTLSPERKSLLQDAAVVGKVFWSGAVCEIGRREPDNVEVALHELARKELVRPSRASSMEGESEYAFWHLLVRDVAYAQIPRAERVRRHRSAAAWLESKVGDSVESVAEVLAYHYLQALELAEAAGEAAQVEELVRPARRFLALAGERALGLDTAQAEARLARALELTPLDDPERAELLVRWADAAFQAGRAPEAALRLEQVLSFLRARGDKVAAAQALQLRSRIAQRLGEGRQVDLAGEAVGLLELEPPGPALVAAFAQLANVHMIAGAYAEAISAADRACELASTLRLPEPARALGYRGFARAFLGDADGLVEMERAVALLIESGAGRDAAILQNNLAIARYPLEGPDRSFVAFEEGLEFCQLRGLAESGAQLEANFPGLLAELGLVDAALERGSTLVVELEAREDVYALIEVRAVLLACRLARGEQPARAEVEWLIDTARTIGTVDITLIAFVAAAAALVTVAPERSVDLLAAVDQKPGGRETPYYARQLCAMVRIALVTGDRTIAERLLDGLEPHHPLNEHALCAARAQLVEYAGDHNDAAVLYAEAAARWHQFGNVPERAHALLGQGRCLQALGKTEALEPLREAHDLFASMGYEPPLAETEALLRQTTPAPAG